jgi:hypothetical protein
MSRGISAERPPSVLAVCFVVIETFFGVVTQLDVARLGLKSSQIQEHYAFAIRSADGRLRFGWEHKRSFEDVLSAAPNRLGFCLILMTSINLLLINLLKTKIQSNKFCQKRTVCRSQSRTFLFHPRSKGTCAEDLAWGKDASSNKFLLLIKLQIVLIPDLGWLAVVLTAQRVLKQQASIKILSHQSADTVTFFVVILPWFK